MPDLETTCFVAFLDCRLHTNWICANTLVKPYFYADLDMTMLTNTIIIASRELWFITTVFHINNRMLMYTKLSEGICSIGALPNTPFYKFEYININRFIYF